MGDVNGEMLSNVQHLAFSTWHLALRVEMEFPLIFRYILDRWNIAVSFLFGFSQLIGMGGWGVSGSFAYEACTIPIGYFRPFLLLFNFYFYLISF